MVGVQAFFAAANHVAVWGARVKSMKLFGYPHFPSYAGAGARRIASRRSPPESGGGEGGSAHAAPTSIAWHNLYFPRPNILKYIERGARRFSPRADCNVALRAWEGSFDYAYLAKWPRIEGQLMPVVFVTILQDGGCGRTTRKVTTLLHSTENGEQLIQPLNERSVYALQGVSREVQPNQTAAVRTTRDTCYADLSGIWQLSEMTSIRIMPDNKMSTYEHMINALLYRVGTWGYGPDTGVPVLPEYSTLVCLI
jgi:hypothetical protein